MFVVGLLSEDLKLLRFLESLEAKILTESLLL